MSYTKPLKSAMRYSVNVDRKISNFWSNVNEIVQKFKRL
jgi:hypothetical protein